MMVDTHSNKIVPVGSAMTHRDDTASHHNYATAKRHRNTSTADVSAEKLYTST